MKKLITIIIASFIFCGLAFSQESDKKALNLLEKVAKKTKSFQGFHVEFTFTVNNLHDSTKQSFDGDFWFRDKDYKLDMMNSVIYTDGETNWVYQEETGEVNITEHSENETSEFINPYSFLENYEEDYTCRFVSDKFVHNRPIVEIHLFPEDIESSNYSRIVLKIDKSKNELYQFIFAGNEGVNYMITVRQLNTSKPVTKEDVTFNKSDYPDAEIIDMR